MKTGGPLPSFIERSISAPMEVNEKRQLYCLIVFMNLLHTGPAPNLAKLAKGSGLGLKRGICIFPPLQHLL